MWDPPGPGLEPMSPALAGRFPTTAPPGKGSPSVRLLTHSFYLVRFFKVDNLYSEGPGEPWEIVKPGNVTVTFGGGNIKAMVLKVRFLDPLVLDPLESL